MSRPGSRMRHRARQEFAYRRMQRAWEARYELIETHKEEPPEWTLVAMEYEQARALWLWITDRVAVQWAIEYFDVERERYDRERWLDSQAGK